MAFNNYGWNKSQNDRVEKIAVAKSVAELALKGFKVLYMYAEYKLSCDWLTKVNKLIDTWKETYKDDLRFITTVDQIYRSAFSVPLNIAEGIGKGKGNHSQGYSVACGSLYECITALKTSPFPVPSDVIDDALAVSVHLNATLNKLAVEQLEHLGATIEEIQKVKKQ